jgi:hypothetical protein
MLTPEERARMRDAENRGEFAIRKQARQMEAVEDALEREMRAFERDEAETKARIAAEWRREHWGRPERPPSWEDDDRRSSRPV